MKQCVRVRTFLWLFKKRWFTLHRSHVALMRASVEAASWLVPTLDTSVWCECGSAWALLQRRIGTQRISYFRIRTFRSRITVSQPLSAVIVSGSRVTSCQNVRAAALDVLLWCVGGEEEEEG